MLLLPLFLACAPAKSDPADTVRGSDTSDTSENSDTSDTGDAVFVLTPAGALESDLADAYALWKANWLWDAGKDSEGHALVRVGFQGDASSSPTVSEGQGYGMAILPRMAGVDPDAQALFDGLVRYARAHPSRIDPRLMDWHVPADGSSEGDDDDSAFDGDADIAYGLLLADETWGSDGDIDYAAAAAKVLDGLMESAVGPDSRYPMLGDWVEPSGSDYDQWCLRTSDVMPDHFRRFAAVDPAWEDVISATQLAIETLQTGSAPETGLLPDFAIGRPSAIVPVSAGFLEGSTDGAYNYNAGRDPWRLGADARSFGDPSSTAQALRIAVWAREMTGGDPEKFSSGYALDGTPLPDGTSYTTSFFISTLGPAVALDPEGQAFLDAIWANVAHRTEGYYEDTVTLQAMLVMAGDAP